MDTFCPDTFCPSPKRYHRYQKDSKDRPDPPLSSNPATFMLVHTHPYFLRDRCLYTELLCVKNLDFWPLCPPELGQNTNVYEGE